MKQALRDLRIPESTIQPRDCLARVSLAKNRLVSAGELLSSEDEQAILVGQAYERYNRGLRQSGVLDFDDLLICMVKLLRESPETLRLLQTRYRYLMVDEYQDTNGPQYEIVHLIGSLNKNVCVVGDDDQSIYGWRGADMAKILNFEKDFPGASVVRLESNYRSTPQILEGANAVIRNNRTRHPKTLRPHNAQGEDIIVKRLSDEEQEALYVIEDIRQRVWDQDARYGDIAILFRTAVQPRLFEMRLRQDKIPYTLVGGMSFFDRKEVKDVLAYLRLMANPFDELSFLRVANRPPRGIGATTVERLLSFAAKSGVSVPEVLRRKDIPAELKTPAVQAAREFAALLASYDPGGKNLAETVRAVIRDVRYRDEVYRTYSDAPTQAKRWEAVEEIANMAEIYSRRQDATLAGFLEEMTLNATDDSSDKEKESDTLTLMTLHSAKGLEFREVYLVGMEEGLLPHANSIRSGDVDEERRLTYVGITRAMRRLTISYTASRAKYGKRVNSLPSRFLYEMHGKAVPDALLEHSAKNTLPAEDRPPPTAGKKKKKSAVSRRRA